MKIHEAYQAMRFLKSVFIGYLETFKLIGKSMMASMTATLPGLCSKEITEHTERRTPLWIRNTRCKRLGLLLILGPK